MDDVVAPLAGLSQDSRNVTNSLEVVEQPHTTTTNTTNNNNNNNDNDNNGQEDDDPNNDSQESFTQHELTMTQGNELTQLGMDDDYDDDDDNAGCSQEYYNSPTPIDPLTLPWGRVMPVGPNNNDNNNNAAAAAVADGTMAAAAQFAPPPPRPSSSSRGATEMLPRSPTRAGSIGTRSRSPSVGSEKASGEIGGGGDISPPCIHFLGLRNLLPSDRFNEYSFGRSAKADVTAQKLDVPASIPTESNPQTQQRNDTKRKRHEYVHAMISNRHCRIYCLLANTNTTKTHHGTTNNNNNCGPPEMEVFVEDTSGNGTLINGTTLLRRNERRKLHTGDVICLLNPKLLAKKLRSLAERKMYMSQYSYVFVNLYEQEARHGWGVMSTGGGGNNSNSNSNSNKNKASGGGVVGDLASPMSSHTARKSVVNVRATKCHSINNNDNIKGRRSLFASTSASGGGGGGGGEGMPCQQLLHQQQQHHQPASSNNNNSKKAPSSLGSFLNNPQYTQSSNDNNNANTRRRRVEEEYDLRDLLGTGTCGEVRRAIHRRTGEERAVKIISIGGRGGGAGPGMSSEKLSAIQAEAEILRSLDHPYVVKLFDMFITPGKAIYLVMELIRGGDLFDRIVERERYTEIQARRLFRRILTAVHYLHEERDIVHRDLKPENILVVDRRSDVNIKLTDFGLAKNMTAEGLKTFCGTPQYFAPEVLRRRHTVTGNGRYGKEIDCWSIGVILFILLSGSPPFDVSAGFDAVANAKVAFYEDQWKHVSREARDLVKRLLEKDPRRRMSVKNACRHAWVLVEDGDTHCHPLHDPVVVGSDGGAASAVSTVAGKTSDISECGSANSLGGTKNGSECRTLNDQSKPAESNTSHATYKAPESRTSNATSKPSSSPWRKACRPVDANALSPISMHKKNNRGKFQCLSAPQLSKDVRQPSIWPMQGNDKTVTKAIQQACLTSQPSPNGSPIQKKQLFDEPPAPKKMSKQDVESIKAAGNTLPKPVINEESRLIKKVPAPKKKVQSTLFPTDAGKQQGNSKTVVQLPEKVVDGIKNKRKSQTSTVTPPGNEQSLVFRLNKKHKVGGKYISPGTRENVTTTAKIAAPVKKSELSDDELQDFSDDEGPPTAAGGKSPQKSEKNSLAKYLRKNKMDSIESSASVGIGNEPQWNQSQQSVEKEIPRPASKESSESKNPSTSEDAQKLNTANRKLVQSFLFGKPPPNNGVSSEQETNLPTINDGANTTTTTDVDHSRPNEMQVDGGTGELHRQSSLESIGTGTAASKGKQRSIKSWFQPKK